MKTLIEAIRPTTFVESEKLSRLLNTDVTLVSETFQHTGSFKFRAAYNLALNIPNDEILTASSGNFGQALAFACQLLNKKCTVVMPETSAKVKIEAVRSYGATVDLIDTRSVGRSERVSQLAEKMPDAYLASAYDDLLVIEGNSTLGDEIAHYKKDFDVVIVPIGGGGLISGISQGLCRNGHRARLVGAEPLLGNDASRSLKAGRIIKNEREPQTLADGARTVSLGEHNWKIIEKGVVDILEISEEKIAEGVRVLFSYANLKVEPTGALSLGAVLEDSEKFADKKVCAVVSGGNVDAEIYRRIIA
ncbi:MAG: pyridoxal-phosphate dependent enzyme [Acidobacteria bacterium]|jgi:threonine dehydratase|nr:pyridoxal-phosphate dependent enzyme [Acidobacteriota bacterium]